MKQGALIFDKQANRYDIRSDLADYYVSCTMEKPLT